MMSELPNIYPFRRSGEQVAQPVYRQRRFSSSRSLSRLARMGALGLAAFLLARAQILGGLYPFGPAFVAAAAVIWPRRGTLVLLPVLAGLYTALSGPVFLVYGAISTLLATIFLLYNVDSKKQWFVTPGMVVAAIMVSKGLQLSLTTFTDYQLLIGIFESLISAGLSLIFLVILAALRRFDVARHFSVDETVCLFLAAMGLLCGLNGWSIGPVDVQSMLSRLFILVVAYLGGGGAGAAIGALVGVIPSLSQIIAPTTVAVYAFSGLLAGVFGSFGRLGASLGFLLGNLILALYLLGAGEISASLLASAGGALFFLLLPTKLYRRLKRAFSATGLRSAKEEKNERLLHLAVRKLKHSGWAFRELSAALGQGPEEADNEESDVRVCMEQLSHQLCSHCSLKDICWELDYHQTFNGILTMFRQVQVASVARVQDAPENFAKRCPHIKELVAVVNCLYDLYCRSHYWRQQRRSSRSLLSTQLTGAAEALERIAREIVEFGDEREVLERELERAMSRQGLPVEQAGISSINDKAVDLWVQYVQCPGEGFCRQTVEGEVSRLLGVGFAVHEHTCGGKACSSRCSYRLLASGAYRLTVGKAQLSRDGRDVCGDSGGSILLDEGRELLMISDGMGVGSRAAMESGAAITMISRLLETGFNQDTAIDVVNAALSLRGQSESFVTLDVCVVDLYSGTADFIKSGSAASYIKRGGNATVIKGHSLPVGMLPSVDKEITNEAVAPGDMIIMASDGLLDMDIDEEGAWLARVISQAVVKDPQAMAEYLLDKVVCISNGKLKDDITVLVAQLSESA